MTRRRDMFLALAGFLLLVFVGLRIGSDAVIKELAAVRTGVAIIVALSLVRLVLQTRAWAIALRQDGLLLFGGITAGLYRQRGPTELTYGYLFIIGCTLSIAVTRLQRKLATAPGRPHEYAGRLNHLLELDNSNLVSRVVRQIHIFIKKGVSIHYLLIFTVLGGLPWLLRLAALGSNLTWTLALYFNRRFFRPGKPGTMVSEV